MDKESERQLGPIERLEIAVKEITEALQRLPESQLDAAEARLLFVLDAALDRRAAVRARATLAAWRERN